MSRSKKSSKGPGSEYWSKRPGTKKVNSPGKFAKKINTRLERIESKKKVAEGLEECPVCDLLCELDGSHYCHLCDEYICDCYCNCK